MHHLVLKAIAFALVIVFNFSGNAQLCQGSLGDPIVNTTFGSGQNPGTPLSAAATNYTYIGNDCPADGFYTVRNNSIGCFGTTWHSVSADHTGNANGYFMLVNASFQPSAFYVDTVNLYCSNTTYEFAAWVMNMAKPTICNGNPIQPNLTFRIERTDGTVLQSYNTNNIPSESTPIWRQHGFFFTTPAGVNRIVLRITNNAPGGCGNDLGLDDITFRPCGPLLSATIGGSGNARNICSGIASQVNMSVNVSPGYPDPYFQWQRSTDQVSWTDIPAANTSTLNIDFPATTPVGNYFFRMAVSKQENISITTCRVNSPVLTVRVNANPVTSVINSGPVCEGANANISASGGTSYVWSGPNGFSANSSSVLFNGVQSSQAGRYYVIVSNAAGCSTLDSTTLAVNPKPEALVADDSVTICFGDDIRISATGGSSYQWTPSSGLSSDSDDDPLAAPSDSTVYRVIVSNAFSCTDTAFVFVGVIPEPVIDAGPDVAILEGKSVQLKGSVIGVNLQYVWRPDLFINDLNILQPVVSPLVDTAYILDAVSADGCGTFSDTVKVKVYKKVVVPNAFSPNGDGINDQWMIPALMAYSNFFLQVYNRYGQLVYSTRKYSRAWDGTFNGKPLPLGAYYYVLDLKESGIVQTGTVTVLR
jgi:gliding motility-associated-like protein